MEDLGIGDAADLDGLELVDGLVARKALTEIHLEVGR